jgi:O-antigen ligase
MFVAPLVLNTIILCNSRGATLGLIVAGVLTFVLARSGHRMRAVAMACVVAVSLFALADPQFLRRQQQTSYDDGSAQGRIEAWRGSVQLVKDHPFGAGGEGFYELSPQYASALVEQLGEKRDPHNTFVLVASEWGILGICLFIGYIVSVFRLLGEVRRTALDSMWYYRSVAIQLAMVGLLVAGCFTDRLYSEAPYWMGAFAVALHRIHRHELAKSKAPAEAPAVQQAALPPGRVPFPRPPIAGARRGLSSRCAASVASCPANATTSPLQGWSGWRASFAIADRTMKARGRTSAIRRLRGWPIAA